MSLWSYDLIELGWGSGLPSGSYIFQTFTLLFASINVFLSGSEERKCSFHGQNSIKVIFKSGQLKKVDQKKRGLLCWSPFPIWHLFLWSSCWLKEACWITCLFPALNTVKDGKIRPTQSCSVSLSKSSLCLKTIKATYGENVNELDESSATLLDYTSLKPFRFWNCSKNR